MKINWKRLRLLLLVRSLISVSLATPIAISSLNHSVAVQKGRATATPVPELKMSGKVELLINSSNRDIRWDKML